MSFLSFVLFLNLTTISDTMTALAMQQAAAAAAGVSATSGMPFSMQLTAPTPQFTNNTNVAQSEAPANNAPNSTTV